MNIYKFKEKSEIDYIEEPPEDNSELAHSALDLFPMRAALGLYTLYPRSEEPREEQ